MRVLNVIVALALVALVPSAAWAWGAEKVLLKDVKALTLQRGLMTRGRRSAPVPQMLCVGGSACGVAGAEPEVMQCVNVGWDGSDVQWKCEAELDQRFRLGTTTVSCEGYAYPDDPYVLTGSCGVEYTLLHTNAQPHSSYDSFYGRGGSYAYGGGGSSSGSLASVLWLVLVGLIVYAIWTSYRDSRRGYGGGGGTGGGSYGGSYDNGPGFPGGGGGGGGPLPSVGMRGAGTGWWGGFTAGGLLGYLLGGWNRPRYNYGYGGGYGGGYGYAAMPRLGGFGSGGGGGGFRSSGGSTTRTSAGFGGTRRR